MFFLLDTAAHCYCYGSLHSQIHSLARLSVCSSGYNVEAFFFNSAMFSLSDACAVCVCSVALVVIGWGPLCRREKNGRWRDAETEGGVGGVVLCLIEKENRCCVRVHEEWCVVVGSRVLFLGSVCDKGGDEDSSIQELSIEFVGVGLWGIADCVGG